MARSRHLELDTPHSVSRMALTKFLNIYVFVLGWYWAFGWVLISSNRAPEYPLPQPVWFALCTSLCMLGLVIMMGGGRAEVLYPEAAPPTDHGRYVQHRPPPKLSWRHDDLRIVRLDGWRQHVAIRGMGRLSSRTWWLTPFVL